MHMHIHIYTTGALLYFAVVTSWWRQQIETFSALLALCAGNSPVTGEFVSQRPVTRNFDVFFDLLLNQRLSKQSWGWWFETPSRSLCGYCNDITRIYRDPLVVYPLALGNRMHDSQDSKVYGANMGPTRVLSAPDGPHVGPMNLAIGVST